MERLAALVWRKWEDSGMGTPVTSLHQWMVDLAADPEITDAKLRSVVGDLVMRSHGVKLPFRRTPNGSTRASSSAMASPRLSHP
jgi:hypothetical protein